MTPEHFETILAKASPRPWVRFHDNREDGPCRCHCGQIWSRAARDGEGELLFVPARDDDDNHVERVDDGRAIVATMNISDLLVELWKAAWDVRHHTGFDSPDADSAELRFHNALRKLQDL